MKNTDFKKVNDVNHEYKLFFSALHCRLKFMSAPIDTPLKLTIKDMAKESKETIKLIMEQK